MTELLQEDAQARERASAPGLSVLLEAPAGSGKTAVLTERFLKLLCTVEDPQQILAITFTRKAAAEMRARVEQALSGRLPEGHARAPELRALAAAALRHAQARGWRLSEEPHSLRIQTIDAFNYWLASELPLAARVGSALRITETTRPLYLRAARRTLSALEADPAAAVDTALLFERYDNEWLRLEGLIADMLEQRGHWLRHVLQADTAELTARVDAALRALSAAHLQRLCELLPTQLRRAAAALPGITRLGEAPEDLESWRCLQHLTQTDKEQWRARLYAHVLAPEYEDPNACGALRELISVLRGIDGAREELAALRRVPPAALPPSEAAALCALARVLSRAAAELHGQFAAAGAVDYTYVSGAARAALTESGEPTDLALRTGLNLRHILVDEFQDTSLSQFQLLQALTRAWEPGDGRTLFVVGDPMQSIYRFRDAEVALFLRARASGIGEVPLTPLRLRRNFRARPALVDFANELFAQVFPRADDLATAAVSYRASLASRAGPAQEGQAVHLRLFAKAAEEAAAIAARIVGLRAQAPAARIAVLVAAHSHAVPVVAALRAQGVSVQGVDLVPLSECVIVRDLVQLCSALYDLADRNAWLSVLRAPWCGAQLASLTALTHALKSGTLLEALGDPARLALCASDDLPALRRVRTLLGGAWQRAGLDPVADWLEATWLQLGASDAYAPEELQEARAFFNALAARSVAGEWQGPEDFPALLQSLFSAAGTADAYPVQVMTIHRAKGLEFDHVLLPALARPGGGDARRLLRWVDLPPEDEEAQLLLAPAPAPEAARESTLEAYLQHLLTVRTQHERARLLYVAVTRARESLWLSGTPKCASDDTPRVDARSLLACLWPVLQSRFLRENAAVEPPLSALPARVRRLRPDWRPPSLPPGAPMVRLPAAHLPLEPPEFSWVGETQRHVGTLVHAWLARLAVARELPAEAALERERPALLAHLARSGVAARERPRAADLILTAMRRTLADERGRWILNGAHRAAHAELALSGLSEGRLRSVVIDRTFIDADGTRWVVDFKTSRHEGGALEGFLAQELERYAPQLRTYRALAQSLGNEPVRAALYFPLLGAFRELP